MLVYEFLAFFIMFPGLIMSYTIPKVAIIGGGIAGTSSAYFLKQMFQGKAAISLFERDRIGGRLKLFDIDGEKYEVGGSVIHLRNYYMNQFTKLLGYGIRKPQSGRLGIYDGQKFIFEESSWYFVTIADLIWRYGLSLFQLNKDVNSMLNDFSRIYTLQDQGYAYTTVDQLLRAINPTFVNMTKTSLSKILRGKGYTQKFMDEFIQSIMLVNYGQTNDISGLAGYVALAGADNNLWSVEGGNKLVAEGVLKFSEARVLKANVQHVELLSDRKFAIIYKDLSKEDLYKKEIYDMVILAAPLIKGRVNVKFFNFTQDFQKYARAYHQTVATLIKGTLKAGYFNTASLPDEILTNNANLLFNSVGKCSPVGIEENFDGDFYEKIMEKTDGGNNEKTDEGNDEKTDEGNDEKGDEMNDEESVYKIFSQKPLSRESIEKLFDSIGIVKEKVWLAYPHYKPPEKFAPFVLHPGLYYTNAIELSASAMEMSVIAARNVALLIHNYWKNVNKNDILNPILKDEL